MKKYLYFIAAGIALVTVQCTKNNQGQNQSVRNSITDNTAKISGALEKITSSKAYQLITLDQPATKSEYDFRDSITLQMIAGIYDYQPDSVLHNNMYFPYRLFKKTGTSSDLIVNLPEKLVMHPRYLHMYNHSDSILANDFTIKATDYHLFYTPWSNYDYKLNAGFTLKSEDIGNLSMSSSWQSGVAGRSSTSFTFPQGYKISKVWQADDTLKAIFSLTQDEDTLFAESARLSRLAGQSIERQYILTVGNVEIRRTSGIDSVQVFQNGILQKKAAAKIINNQESSVFTGRDFLLTFNDGTTAKLSDLLSPVINELETLSTSLGEMYFSKNIIDYIALSIYFSNLNANGS